MNKELRPLDVLKVEITRMSPQFQMALPKHISTEKFTRVLITAISTNELLVTATRQSLFAACMRSAQEGLLPDGRESAIVTYKTKDGNVTAQFMPMVAGILKKVRNSGELSSITAQIVHANDKFRYWVDSDGEHIEHEPNFFSDRGPRIGVYSFAKTKDGGIYMEVLTSKQIEAIRSSSKSAQYGPWSGPFEDEMIKKSAIKRLSKRLPMSTDLDSLMKADDDLYEFKNDPIVEEKNITPVEQIEPKAKPKSKIERIVEAKSVKQKEPVQENQDDSTRDDTVQDREAEVDSLPL